MAKKKFGSLDAIFEGPKTLSTVSIKRYQSNYDYTDISDDDKEVIVNFEEEIIINKNEINKGYFKIAKNLYEVNNILASYDNTHGKFIKWFEEIGLKRTFVYNSIKRFELYLLIEDEEKINKLSQKAVEMIGSKKIEDSMRIKLLKTDGIEKINDKTLKNQILNIISERSEMIRNESAIKEAEIVNENISKEQKEKQILTIKRLLNKIESKMNGEISKKQFEKLKRIEEILREIEA